MDTIYSLTEMLDIIDVICTLGTELHSINAANGPELASTNLVQCKVGAVLPTSGTMGTA